MPAFKIFDNDIDFDTLQEYLGNEAIALDTEKMGLIPRRYRLCVIQIFNDNRKKIGEPLQTFCKYLVLCN